MTLRKPIEDYFINNDRYLHHINQKDITQVMNFLAGGGGYATPTSLDVPFLKEIGANHIRITSVEEQKKFLNYTENQLRFDISGIIGVSLSPRSKIMITASKFRNGQKVGEVKEYASPTEEKGGWTSHKLNLVWSNKVFKTEKEILNISETEIAFEIGRRKYAPESPSRLTCLFMVRNSLLGRDTLSSMFFKKETSKYSPMILELAICKIDKLVELDSIWYNRHIIEGTNEDYVKNYWAGIYSDMPKKEILFEGIVAVSQLEQRTELKLILDQFTQNNN